MPSAVEEDAYTTSGEAVRLLTRIIAVWFLFLLALLSLRR